MSAPTPSYDRVAAVFNARDARASTDLYNELKGHGALGLLAVDLCRARKNSGLAKQYRGRNAKGAAYETKEWSIGNITKLLTTHGERLGIVWGWKQDPAQARHDWVLYVEAPTGQVSFHTGGRGNGPDFPGNWDQQGLTAERIIALAAHVLDGTKPVHFGPPVDPPAVPVPDRRQRPRVVAPPGDDEPPLPLGLPT